jgi:hypothetical protein
MRFNNLYEMNMDLVASTAAYVTSIDGFSQKCPIGRYQFVFEIVSFFFEDYRDEFNQLAAMRMSSFHSMDAVVFISWCSCETFNLIKDVSRNQDMR